jgi:DNA-binding MarR family transcriptional regulator
MAESNVSPQSFDFRNAPGYLIRRAHQVSVAIFMDAAAQLDITPVQFAILNALIDSPGIDQVSLAQQVAMDAATSGSVIGRLESKGWLKRELDESDRRRRRLWVTPAGCEVVAQLKGPIGESQRRLMAPLAPQEVQELRRLLEKLVTGAGETGV